MKVIALVALLAASTATAGPLTMGLCQTACNAGYGTCCVAAGAVAGTFSLGLGAPAALILCSAIQGTCMAACVPLLAAPTP